MNKVYDPLYKLDSKAKTRIWYMEQDGDKFRTHDGLIDGGVKASGWKVAKPTNVGRSNERQGIEQSVFEIEARYEKQLKGAYYTNINDIHLGCRFVEPMLADKYEKFLPGEAQPKLDGFRCLLRADGGWSREGEILPGARHLVRAMAERGVFDRIPGLTLDGELYNHDLKDEFGKLSSLIKKQNPTSDELLIVESTVQFHAYDMFVLTTELPWIIPNPKPRRERISQLAVLIQAINSDLLHLVRSANVTSESDYDTLHGSWIAEGYEGSMWRPNEAHYEIGRRSKVLQKRKDFDDAEFDVVRIEEGEGNWSGAAKRVVCWLPGADRTTGPTKENTFEAGIRGTKPRGVELLGEKHNVVTIRYFGFTPSAIPKPRFGVATKFHGQARTL